MLQVKRIRVAVTKCFSGTSKTAAVIAGCALFHLLTVILFSSCNGAVKTAAKINTDTVVINLPLPSQLAANEKEKLGSRCKAWYDTVLKNRGFNGGIIVAKNGNIVFEDYSGTGHVGGNDSVTAGTPFHIASVSKTFTAMMVVKFWQEGKLKLDEELSKYFPTFNYPGVTIRTLLNHRSGLPNYVYFMESLGWDKKAYVKNDDVFTYLTTRKQELKNIAPPNTHFAYCNTNYALLALLLEKISGISYSALLQQQLFVPLHMKNSFVFDTTMMAKVNPSYDWRGRIMPFNFLDAVYGDKNIYSTPEDLLIWDRALNSGKIFTEKTLQEVYAPYSNEKPGIRNYGLGWRMNTYPNGKKMIYHNGWWHGNNASFVRLTQDSATIIVVSNKFNRSVYHAKNLSVLFGDYGGAVEEEEDPNTAPANKEMIVNDTLQNIVTTPLPVPVHLPPVRLNVKKTKAAPVKKIPAKKMVIKKPVVKKVAAKKIIKKK